MVKTQMFVLRSLGKAGSLVQLEKGVSFIETVGSTPTRVYLKGLIVQGSLRRMGFHSHLPGQNYVIKLSVIFGETHLIGEKWKGQKCFRARHLPAF